MVSRRRTRGGSDPPEERLKLRVPLEEARQLVRERISEGQQLLEAQRPSADFSAAAARWDRYNRDLISERLFESEDAVHRFYSSPSVAFVSLNAGADEVAAMQAQDVQRKNNQLASLLERLALFDRQAPAGEGGNTPEGSIAALGPVFLVHGHDTGALSTAARFLERDLGLETVVLSERPDVGTITIIEKLEREAAPAGYAIAVVTPDDSSEPGQRRARQNVIFELGYFIAKLTRARVKVLRKGTVEWFSDLDGSLYIEFDDHGGWKEKLRRELVAAGYSV